MVQGKNNSSETKTSMLLLYLRNSWHFTFLEASIYREKKPALGYFYVVGHWISILQPTYYLPNKFWAWTFFSKKALNTFCKIVDFQKWG